MKTEPISRNRVSISFTKEDYDYLRERAYHEKTMIAKLVRAAIKKMRDDEK